MARKKKSKVKRKRTGKRGKPKKRSARNVDVFTPHVSDEALELAGASPIGTVGLGPESVGPAPMCSGNLVCDVKF